MATNLIRNGSFSRQGKYWKTYSWHSGNTIDFQENGGRLEAVLNCLFQVQVIRGRVLYFSLSPW